jgi:hypothetical protein
MHVVAGQVEPYRQPGLRVGHDELPEPQRLFRRLGRCKSSPKDEANHNQDRNSAAHGRVLPTRAHPNAEMIPATIRMLAFP